MKSKARSFGPVALLCLLGALVPARAVPIMPLDDLKPGMKGYGLTVYQGTTIERFPITIIGVLRAFDFQMDMVLITVDGGPVLTQKLNTVAGMSGSPIYVNDRLVGAYAYGFEFQSTPIAGVTPIEQMLEHFDPRHPQAKAMRARRAAASSQLAAGTLHPEGGVLTIGQRPYAEFHVAPNRREAETLQRIRPDVGIMTPVSTPVLVSGAGGAAMPMIRRMLEPFNLVPMQVGGTQVPADTKVDFSPGAAVAVALARGDIEFTAIGTLTYRDKDTVLAFGHPFFGLGGCELPMCTAYITTIIPALSGSFKMGSAISAVGSITQDRPTCVGGTIGKMAETIPLEYHMTDVRRGAERVFHFSAVRQPQITEMLSATLLQGAMQNTAGQMFDGVMNSRVEVVCRNGKGGEPLTIVRQNSFDTKLGGPGGMNLPLQDLMQTMSLLRVNPWGDAPVQSVKVNLDFEADRRLANIERVQTAKQVVKRGETVNLTAYLKVYGGKAEPLTIPVTIPEHAPLGATAVVLVGGSIAGMVRDELNPEPFPRDVPTMVRYLNSAVRNDCIMVEMIQPSHGLEFSGRVLRDLPMPIADALFTADIKGLQPRPDVQERLVQTAGVVTGVRAVALEVVSEEGRRSKQGAETPDVGDPDLGLGGGGMGGMGGMAMAAERDLARLMGTSLQTDELRWMGDSFADPAGLRDTLKSSLKAAFSSLPARPQRRAAAVDTAEPAPKPPTAGKPPEKGAPDVTSSLDLGKPPKMPAYSELADVADGKLDTGGSDSGSNSEEEGGDAVARPVATWSLTKAEDFADGQFKGTYSDTAGTISLAPPATKVGRPDVERAWGVLPRPDGSVVVGSWGEKAKLVRVSADGKSETLAEVDDAGLMALTALPDGAIIAGGIPSGKLYKVAGGKVETFAQLEEPYIWALLPDGKGGLYAATGNHGRVYHVDAAGKAETVMQVADRHVMALAPAPGGFYAGTFPDGKVYRVRDAKVETVFQIEEGSVMALAATPLGQLYVGSSQGSVVRVSPDGSYRELEEAADGSVYSLVAVGETAYAALASPARLLRFDADNVSASVYRNDEPYLLGLAVDGKDQLVVSTAASGEVTRINLPGGEKGTYTSEVHDCGMVAKWGRVRWGQHVTGHSVVGVEVRTGNTAEPDQAWSPWSPLLTTPNGSVVPSPPGRYVQFRLTFLGQPGDSAKVDRVDLLYRTVNRAPTVQVTAPTAGQAVRGKVKVEWEGGDPDDDEPDYEVFYAPAGSGKWTKIDADAEKSSDEPKEDGADISDSAGSGSHSGHKGVTAPGGKHPDAKPAHPDKPTPKPEAVGSPQPLQFGAPASAPHNSSASHRGSKAKGHDASGEDSKHTSHSEESLSSSDLEWDTAELPDGLYEIKVVASDAKRNPDDPRTAEAHSRLFVVDNTPPRAAFLESEHARPLPPTFKFEEAATWIASAEYRFDDADDWQGWVPVDGLADSRTEEFKAPKPPTEAGDHTLWMRVRDNAGNVLKAKWLFTVGK